MNRICFNTRDELTVIDLDRLACVRAESNYSELIYVEGEKTVITTGISRVEQMIAQAFASQKRRNPFVRLGRSCMINHLYLCRIDVLHQTVLLGDFGQHRLTIKVPKALIRDYKNRIEESFNSKS